MGANKLGTLSKLSHQASPPTHTTETNPYSRFHEGYFSEMGYLGREVEAPGG